MYYLPVVPPSLSFDASLLGGWRSLSGRAVGPVSDQSPRRRRRFTGGALDELSSSLLDAEVPGVGSGASTVTLVLSGSGLDVGWLVSSQLMSFFSTWG